MGAVYDVTICYRGNQDPSVLGVVNAESSAADIAVRRFDMAEILRDNPDDEALADWLVNLYKEKVRAQHAQSVAFDCSSSNTPCSHFTSFAKDVLASEQGKRGWA